MADEPTPCLTRRVLSAFDRCTAWCARHKWLWRVLHVLIALGVCIWLYCLWLSATTVVAIAAAFVVTALLAETYDLLLDLPALLGIVAFWCCASLAAAVDLFLFNAQLWRVPENRLALVINAVNLPLMAMTVWSLVLM